MLAAGLMGLAGHGAVAMINPAFTPVVLVEDARRVVVGRLEGQEQGDRWTLTAARTLKGDGAGAPPLSLALLNVRDTELARGYLRACDGMPAALFLGDEAGFLLVETVWMTLSRASTAEWQITEFGDQDMLKTYAGGADKLAEMAAYILHDEDADVPVEVGVHWRQQVPVARLRLPAAGMEALPAGGCAAARLFVASPAGDRLFAWDDARGGFDDATEPAGVDTASRQFAFVDLDRDGCADLASWDGAELTVRLGRADGGFALAPVARRTEWPAACRSLDVVSPRQDGSPGLLMGAEWPLLLSWEGDGWSAAPLPGSKAHDAAAGPAGPCVVMDWDGDGYADVLRLGAAGSLLWRGRDGGFGEPEACEVRSGGPPVSWAVGDFDGDGRPDLFVSGSDACELWENAGAGAFRPAIGYAGSLAYKQEPGAADCLATDLNHDGRPDLALFYEDGEFFYHFNRGYRCMAEEGQLTLDAGAPGEGGPTCAAAGDFDGDGALDLAVAFAGGQVRCFFNDASEVPGLWVRLPRGCTGPVAVSAWQGDAHAFCVGAHAVTGFDPPTFVCLRRRGACVLRWRGPGGTPQEVTAEDGAEAMLPREPVPAWRGTGGSDR